MTLPPELHALATRLAALAPAERAQALDGIALSQRQAIVAAILDQPLLKATIGSAWVPHAKQVEARRLLDDPNVLHFGMYGGARSGKSVLAVRTVIERAVLAPGSRHLIARHRFNAARNSTWRATLPETLARCFPGLEATPNNSEFFYKLSNGSEIHVSGLDSDERTEKILGTEFLTALLEECSEIAWPTVELVTTRVAQRFPGVEPKIIYCENPPMRGHWSYAVFIAKRNPEPPQRALDRPERYACIQINPVHNQANLPAVFIEGLQTGSARKVLRFWRGEFGDHDETALWSLEAIERYRIMKTPENLVRVVVAIDPSGTAGASDDGDAVGVVVGGIDMAGVCYVLEDRTAKLPPAEWGKVAVSCYSRWDADAIVIERNFGGAMCEAVVQAAAAEAKVRVTIKEVVASRGKSIRAEPISALYATGKVVHVGHYPELEDELLGFTSTGFMGSRSPNRADAAIWMVTELFPRVMRVARDEMAAQEPRRRPPKVINSTQARKEGLGIYRRHPR